MLPRNSHDPTQRHEHFRQYDLQEWDPKIRSKGYTHSRWCVRIHRGSNYLEGQLFVTYESAEPGEHSVEKRDKGYKGHDIRYYT